MSALTVGISGLSSTGKTSLSRLLRRIFPNSFILHQDDFYLTDSEIPIDAASGLQDWDCPGAFNFDKMTAALAHIRQHGSLQDGVRSLTDESAVDDVNKPLVPGEVVERLAQRVRDSGTVKKVAIVDGILMFHEAGSSVEAQLDVRVMLRARYLVAKERRENREGYVTIEGFWADPPGYFDKIVWPNYVKEHRHLFVDEDVEAELKLEVAQKRRILSPKIDMPMTEVLEWMVDEILKAQKES